MEIFWTALNGVVALVWIVQALRSYFGMAKLPRIARVPPLANQHCPKVSVLFAARDEARRLPRALASLLAQDYPNYEVIGVDDRSRDATGKILEDFAQTNSRLKVVHIVELPPGWVGKPHGLQQAYEHATGEWLIFTDADVRFAPDLVSRAMQLVKEKGWDHLTLLGQLDLVGFWEKTATIYFGVGFAFGVEPWRVHHPRSRRYMGAGYFQLLWRSTYETIGTHRRLAMEVVDDMKLGKLVKLGGFRSGVAIAPDHVRLRWNEGFVEMIRGVTKNLFAASGYSVLRVVGSVLAIMTISVLPFVALAATRDLPQLFAGVAAATAVAMHSWAAHNNRVSAVYGLTHPLGALIFSYMLLRSMVVTLWRGGVVWRDTFYPLEELRRGQV